MVTQAMRQPRVTLSFDNVFTVADAASQLHVHRTTVYRWIKSQQILASTIGHTLLIPKSEVEKRLKG